MKLKNIVMITVFWLGFNSMALSADGVINFSGFIVDDSCNLLNETTTVTFDNISDESLHQTADTIAHKQLNMDPADCSATTRDKIKFDATVSKMAESKKSNGSVVKRYTFILSYY